MQYPFRNFFIGGKWCDEKYESNDEKSKRIVRQVASFIAAQRREIDCSFVFFPRFDHFVLGRETIIPPLLKLLVGQLVHNWAGIAQTIMQATGPDHASCPSYLA